MPNKNPSVEQKILKYCKLLFQDELDLPLEGRTSDFPKYLGEIFSRFINSISNDDYKDYFDDDQKTCIGDVCKLLQDSIECYYKGITSQAFQIFREAMKLVEKYFDRFYTSYTNGDNPHLYRMRIGNEKVYKREEMFHIPFELRGKVNTQRYSIPGLPSLYVGSSSYICWEELNRPPLSVIQVARIEMNRKCEIKYIDFGYPPKILACLVQEHLRTKRDDMSEDDLYLSVLSYIMCWPVLAACSIEVKEKNDPFKPEYIIPQLLLQWVKVNVNYDGIRYFSVNLKGNKRSFHLFQNYVFPVKDINSSGLCNHLKDLFLISDVLQWQYANALSNDEEISYKNYLYNYGKLHLLNGVEVRYENTDFAKMESILNRSQAEKLP